MEIYFENSQYIKLLMEKGLFPRDNFMKSETTLYNLLRTRKVSFKAQEGRRLLKASLERKFCMFSSLRKIQIQELMSFKIGRASTLSICTLSQMEC